MTSPTPAPDFPTLERLARELADTGRPPVDIEAWRTRINAHKTLNRRIKTVQAAFDRAEHLLRDYAASRFST